MKREEVDRLAKPFEAEIVETHISWVLLTKKMAYKIKKPLQTNFLDYSSLTKRKKYCYKELNLNKELSPDIYLEVVGIKKSEDKFMFAPEGERAVEYAVKMKRLDSSRQMNIMLSNDLVKEVHIRSLAKSIALFHKRTTIIKKEKPLEGMVKDFNDLLTVKGEIAEYLGKDTCRETQEAVERVNAFLKINSAIFLERVKKGFVRDGHGDLHSGNIFIYKNPVLFDRIEFNDCFRHIDVLHEIGFLCMDLEAYGKKGMSKQMLEYYSKYSGMEIAEREKLVLNYYKCYTANVRAKVNLIGAKEENKNKKRYISEAKKYLKMMLNYIRLLTNKQE